MFKTPFWQRTIDPGYSTRVAVMRWHLGSGYTQGQSNPYRGRATCKFVPVKTYHTWFRIGGVWWGAKTIQRAKTFLLKHHLCSMSQTPCPYIKNVVGKDVAAFGLLWEQLSSACRERYLVLFTVEGVVFLFVALVSAQSRLRQPNRRPFRTRPPLWPNNSMDGAQQASFSHFKSTTTFDYKDPS